MSLADYSPLTKTVPIRGGSLIVRGLSLDDVSVLMNNHLPDLDSLMKMYDDSLDAASRVTASAQFAVKLAREAPALVANIIALAADEPNEVEKARKLSLPVQVELLKVIFTLTFEEAGGAKKFYESLGMLLTGLAPPRQTTDSPT